MKALMASLDRLRDITDASRKLERAIKATDAARHAALRDVFHEFRQSGMEQRELVAISGFLQGSLSRWMNGKTQPNAATTDALCRAIETAAKLRQETDR